jgi:hypothetical protein
MVRLQLIHEFEAVKEAADVRDGHVLDVLATAGLDLSYYEPRKELREDRSLYDDKELDRRLRAILRDLGEDEPDPLEPSVWHRVLHRVGVRGDGPARDIARR